MIQRWTELIPAKTRNQLCRPLLVRSATAREDPAFFQDDLAIQMCERLSLDPLQPELRSTRMERQRILARTLHYDKLIRRHLQHRPDLIVVNLGAALDTRFSRVDNGRLRWYDLDLPDVMYVRKTLLPPHERVTLIGRSVFDAAWPLTIAYEEAEQLVFIADHLFVQHPATQVKALMATLARTFPGTLLYGDFVTRFARHIEPEPPVFWLNRSGDVKHLDYRIKVEQAWSVGTLYPERQTAGVRLLNRIPAWRDAGRILKIRFNPEQQA